jgi:hypothetical protein
MNETYVSWVLNFLNQNWILIWFAGFETNKKCLGDEYNLNSIWNCVWVKVVWAFFLRITMVGNDWMYEKLCIMIDVMKISMEYWLK